MRYTTVFTLFTTLLSATAVIAQDAVSLPNANDVALGADPSKPLMSVSPPADLNLSLEKRSNSEEHTFAKRHYGSFICRSTTYNDWCRNTFQNQAGVGALSGCSYENGRDQCWVDCGEVGWVRSGTNVPVCKCDVGYTASADGQQCVLLSSDVNNCGALGRTCTTSGTGVTSGSCVNGACQITCASGYTASSDKRSCIANINYQTDVNNCGTAGNRCTTSGTGVLGGSCSSGLCQISCASGYTASADKKSCIATTNYQTDVNNCGTANNRCTTSGTGVLGGSCSSGVCQISCASGYTASADKKSCIANVNYQTDVNNCGTANNRCTLSGTGVVSGACTNGACTITCAAGYTASADGKSCAPVPVTCKDGTYLLNGACRRYSCSSDGECVTKTGSSTATCTYNVCFVASSNDAGKPLGSPCGTSAESVAPGDDNSCATGLVCMDYKCQNPLTSNNNCGTYGNKCLASAVTGAATSTCVNGACQVTCSTGYTPSADKLSCVPTTSDPQNCGSLNNVCSAPSGATPTCTNGVCGFTCATGLVKSGTTCIDTSSDVKNCGLAGKVCPPPTANGVATCQNGVCSFTCNSGFAKSGSTCASTTSDPANCGSIGKVCPVPTGASAATCVNSVCSFTCPTGFSKTATGCLNTANDPANCGSQGTKCPVPAGSSGATCSNGVCSFTCQTGYIASGPSCVLDTSSDPSNCGLAGRVCPTDVNGVSGCSASQCTLTCNANYTLSNGKCVPNSTSSCGTTQKQCPAPTSGGSATCVNGQCGIQCNSGFVYDASQNTCVAPSTPQSCGSSKTVCPTDPNGTAVCNNGVCGMTCKTNYYYQASTATCVSTGGGSYNSPTACGTSRRDCVAAAPENSTGFCYSTGGLFPTYSCYAYCNAGYSAVNGACVSITDSITNCGRAGNVCPTVTNGSPTCVSGSCGIQCSSGFSYDGTKCISTSSDPKNCAYAGNVCTAPTNATPTCTSSVCSWSCNSGYTKSSDGLGCVNTSNDPMNCGTTPTNTRVCPVPTGARSATCTNGQCGVICLAGYTASNGGCVLDTSSDPKNCGSTGNVCPSDPAGNGIPICSGGQCGLTCNSNTFYSATTKSCVPNSPSACGSSGTQCRAPTGGNGTPVCTNGVCSVQCSTGRTYNAATNTCDAGSTPDSCGPTGRTCPTDPNGTPTCTNQLCGLTCKTGYVYSADDEACIATDNPDSCGIGLFVLKQKCSAPTNGVAICRYGQCGFACNAGYQATGGTYLFGILTTGSCVAISNDPKNCGAVGQSCPASPLNGKAVCVAGTCDVECNLGYDYDEATNKCVATSSDVNNCGFAGNKCYAPANGVAQCSSGSCRFTCLTGYTVSGTSCVLSGSAKSRTKKRSQASFALCPTGETACPIAGSASFAAFAGSSNKLVDFATGKAGAGGFECLDTLSSLESCGGCASTGEGKDCTQIKHSAGVGCSGGQCVVFSCEPGYVASLNNTRCVKTHAGSSKKRHGSKSSSSSNLIH